jgi:hypothetical protein
MLAAGEHPRLPAINAGGSVSRGHPPAAGVTMVVGSLHLIPVMLAEGEHPRLGRRTTVIQQAVDTR